MVKIRLEISYLPGVEDPEATTLHHNLGILGSSDMFTKNADAIFFMSLLNSKDREFLMDHQVNPER